MNVFTKTYYLLSDYVGPEEREVAKFFAGLSEDSSIDKIRPELLGLLQKNIVAVNLWSEHKYRGYKYLNKSKRQELYVNVEAIKNDFNNFCNLYKHTLQEVEAEIHSVGIRLHDINRIKERLMYIRAIMAYLSPQGGRYKYRESSTFGLLLRDPAKEDMVGDCNQIVTLYIYLYGLRYDISELRLRTLPDHVALHFENIDIEATSASFANYGQKGGHILTVEEIVSINLLDVTDEYFKTHKVSNESTLESARIGYILSSRRDIVKHNLDAAYTNLVAEKLKADAYSSALKYAIKSGNKELINTVGHNGALYYMKANQYRTALDYSKHSKDELKLNKLIHHNEAVYYYNSGKYESAANAFERANDQSGVKSCYEALFRDEQQKLGYVGTTEDIKNKSATINKMHLYANKSGNQSMIKYVDKLKKYL